MRPRLWITILLCWVSLSCQERRYADDRSRADLDDRSRADLDDRSQADLSVSSDSGGGSTDAMLAVDQSHSTGPDLADPSCGGVVCTTPPKPECLGSTLRTYSGPGTCAAGTCAFPYTDLVCPVACYSGACSACARPGATMWPCYPPPTIPSTCCGPGQRTCRNGVGCTCYDACS